MKKKETKKSILFIIPSLSGGGAEKTVVNLANILKDDYNVNIIVFTTNNELILDKKINCINLNMQFTKNIFKKVVYSLKKIKRIRKIKKEYNIFCSISFLKRPSLLNVLSKYNEKTIVSFRNKMSEQDNNFLSKLITKYICIKCNYIVALSTMVKYDLETIYKIDNSKIKVIYNPCDVKYIEEMKQKKVDSNLLSKINNRKIILNIGRLSKQKGQTNLILAFKELLQKRQDVVLLILGKGEEEKKITKLIKDLELNENVILYGFVMNPYKYMNISDIFVFSSIYEGLGNALLEAAGAGMPIISTDCKYGPKEILDPNKNLLDTVHEMTLSEYGILIPPFEYEEEKNSRNIKYLAEAMNCLLVNEELRKKYSQLALKRAFDFSPQIIKKQWKKIINKEG